MTRRHLFIRAILIGSFALGAAAVVLVLRHRASLQSASEALSRAKAHPMNEGFRLSDSELADALCGARDGHSSAAYQLFEHYGMWEGRPDALGWLIVGADLGDSRCAYNVGVAYENLGSPDLAVGYLTMAFHAARAAHDPDLEALAADELCQVAGLSIPDLELQLAFQQAAPNPGMQRTRYARR